MRYSLIIICVFLEFKICFSQIKGITEIPNSRIEYVDPHKKPTKNDLLFDSILSRPKRDFYYDDIKFVKDTLRLKYEIDTLNGMLNGKCKIWNINNQLLISGKFLDNQKKGKWIFNYLDNTRTKVIRKYENNYNYKQLKPKRNKQKLKYPTNKSDSLNNIIYPDVTDDEIYISKINWRFIPKNKSNMHLFKENKLWNLLKDNIDNNINIYSDSYFRKTVNNYKLKKALKDAKIEVLGFKIKDLFYCNMTYSITESRLLAICPVVRINSEAKDLFWIFYPEIRDSLSRTSIKTNDNRISTIEETFHERYFNSFIYEIESVNGEQPNSMNIINPELIPSLKDFSIAQEVYHLYMEWEFLYTETKN